MPIWKQNISKKGFPYPVKPARSVVAPFDVMLHHLYQLSIEVRVLTEKNEVLLSVNTKKCVVLSRALFGLVCTEKPIR